MQYHDSGRPRHTNGLPLYQTPGGWLAVIPQMAISPHPQGGYTVGVMLLVGPNSAQWHHTRVMELGPLLDAWGADPEGTMEGVFGWRWRGDLPRESISPRPKVELSLDDLLS